VFAEYYSVLRSLIILCEKFVSRFKKLQHDPLRKRLVLDTLYHGRDIYKLLPWRNSTTTQAICSGLRSTKQPKHFP